MVLLHFTLRLRQVTHDLAFAAGAEPLVLPLRFWAWWGPFVFAVGECRASSDMATVMELWDLSEGNAFQELGQRRGQARF